MDIKDFALYLHNEKACVELVRDIKERKGIICPKCGSSEHYYNARYRSHDCKKCRYRTTLRSGTVMESSKLPFRYCITAMYFMTLTKKSFSALEMQRILKHKRYEPIWAMMHKIRAAIGQHDEKQILFGNVEMASSKITTRQRKNRDIHAVGIGTNLQADKGLKRERTIEIFVSITPPKNTKDKSHRKTALKHVCAFVNPDYKEGLDHGAYETKEKGRFPIKGLSTFRSVNNKASILRQYHPSDYEKQKLHWIRALVSNFRRVINGIHHNITEQYLQNYLNEFSFKTSSHKKEIFDELLVLCIENQWYNNFRYKSG